jgi:hypothetical protein
MLKKISFIVLIIILTAVAYLLCSYYSLPVYTLNPENGILIKNGVVYKQSVELFQKYQRSEIQPVYERPIGRLKGDNPLWFKTFIYKFDDISEEDALLASRPFMIMDFYERTSE